MKRKLFIGVDLDPSLKRMLAKNVEGWRDLPIRWHPEEGLHLPLLYLGHVQENLIDDVTERIRETCSAIDAFDVQFECIELGYKDVQTVHDSRDAKIVRLTGEVNEDLKNLQQDLEEAFDMFVREKKAYRPHVTLGRMRMKKWQELESCPDISQELNVALDVSYVTLFESVRVDDKITYESVGEFELKM